MTDVRADPDAPRPRVLVVDDEESVRLTLAANLELSGFDVVEAASVADAVRCLEQQRVDIVVSDVHMPNRDGVAGLDDLRAVQPDVAVVFVTGYDPEGTLPVAVARGAYTVLPKPLRIDRLVEVVRRAMEQPVVLVVDDEPAFLDALVEGLRLAGVRTERAVDGRSAIEALHSNRVDVCILDLILPERDGAQVLADLRAIDPGIAVIAMTCYDVGEIVREVLRAGASHCLRKPFEIATLTKVIGQARSKPPGGDKRRGSGG